MKPTRQDYLLRLRPLDGPGWQFADPEQRLKLALKRLSRSFGLKCITARPVDPEWSDPTQQG